MKVDQDGHSSPPAPAACSSSTPDAQYLGTLATGEPTANCGWGEDGTTLYITADKSLARIRTKVKGAGW